MADVINMTPGANGKLPHGGQPGNRNAVIHDSHGARRQLRALVARQNDRRTREYRECQERVAAYLPDMGGRESLSAMQVRALVELVRIEQRADAIGAWIDSRPLIYGRRGKASVAPVFRDHMRLTELAMSMRKELGMQRRTKDAMTLEAYLSAKAQGGNGSTAPPAPAVAVVDAEPLPAGADGSGEPGGSDGA